MRSWDSPASKLGRPFATRVFLRAWARVLPFEDLELRNGCWQTVPHGSRYPALQRQCGPDKTTGFQGLRRSPAGLIIFCGEFRKHAPPWPTVFPKLSTKNYQTGWTSTKTLESSCFIGTALALQRRISRAVRNCLPAPVSQLQIFKRKNPCPSPQENPHCKRPPQL